MSLPDLNNHENHKKNYDRMKNLWHYISKNKQSFMVKEVIRSHEVN